MPFLAPFLLLALLGFTLWGNTQQPPRQADMELVETKATLQWQGRDDDGKAKPDAFYTFTSRKSGERLGLGLYDGRELWIRNEDAELWEYEARRYTFLWDQTWDFGAWVGARPGFDPGYDLGVRISPVRTLYGVLSPDLLIGSRSAGLGASVYVPPGWIPRSWDRFGLGIGYLFDYSGDYDGWSPYLSLSTRF